MALGVIRPLLASKLTSLLLGDGGQKAGILARRDSLLQKISENEQNIKCSALKLVDGVSRKCSLLSSALENSALSRVSSGRLTSSAYWSMYLHGSAVAAAAGRGPMPRGSRLTLWALQLRSLFF